MPSDPWITAMRRGDFAAAWHISDRVLAERCARADDCSDWPRHLQFIWNGTPPEDEHVLVRCYHGLGDTIQFVRFLEPLRQRARRITLWAQPPLLSLLRHVRGIDALLPLHDGAPTLAREANVDVELMEVPHLLRVALGDLPGPVPYIHLSASAEPVPMDSESLRVGIAWRSSTWDHRRSIPDAALRPLASIAGVSFHSLQFPPARLPFSAQAMACQNIERLAQRMRSLDLVLSVDTMPAHLAGALGLPTWVLLPEQADWRWLEDRSDSPWYPTMRLFRCRASWLSLLEDVADALARTRDAVTAARCKRSAGCRAFSG